MGVRQERLILGEPTDRNAVNVEDVIKREYEVADGRRRRRRGDIDGRDGEAAAKRALFEHLGYEPHPGQRAIHGGAAPGRRVRSSLRKSLCAAMEGLPQRRWSPPTDRSAGSSHPPTTSQSASSIRLRSLPRAACITALSRFEGRSAPVIRNMGGGLPRSRQVSRQPDLVLGEGLDWAWWTRHRAETGDLGEPPLAASDRQARLGVADLDAEGVGTSTTSSVGQGRIPRTKAGTCRPANPLLDRDVIEQERERHPTGCSGRSSGRSSSRAQVPCSETSASARSDPSRSQFGAGYHGGPDLAKVRLHGARDPEQEPTGGLRRSVPSLDRRSGVLIKAASEMFGDVSLRVDSTGAGELVFESLRQAGYRRGLSLHAIIEGRAREQPRAHDGAQGIVLRRRICVRS